MAIATEDLTPLLPESSSVDGHGKELHLKTSSRHLRGLHILSFTFLLVFLAYHAAQNLESSLNSDEDLGTTSLGILYLSFTVCSFIATPFVRRLGSKNSIILGTSGYWLFIASNLFPSWYTMVPASLYLGFTASVIWVGEGTYLTFAARSHAAECNLPEGTVLGNFNGEFWGMFASTQVIGNLLSLALLKTGTEGKGSGTTLLFIVFLGSMTLGTILGFFLDKQSGTMAGLADQTSDGSHSSVGDLLKATFVPLLDKRMLLLIPLLVYSGLEQAFVWAEFTKYVVSPAIGVSGVGGAMAVFGAADAIELLAILMIFLKMLLIMFLSLIIIMLVLTSWPSLSLFISGVIHLYMRMFLCNYLPSPWFVNAKCFGFTTHRIKLSKPYKNCCMPSWICLDVVSRSFTVNWLKILWKHGSLKIFHIWKQSVRIQRLTFHQTPLRILMNQFRTCSFPRKNHVKQ